MSPDSKGTLWMQWDVFICLIAPRGMIRPPNLFPDFHANERSTVPYAWNITIPNMQETKNLISNLSRLTSAKRDSQ
jgi:hypothetical protein